jgi:hypothetical protein
MKKLLVILIALICFSCNKELPINLKQLSGISNKKLDTAYCIAECIINKKNELNPKITKNYLKTSYELSNFDTWFSSAQLIKTDASNKNNPFIDEQSTQIDIDGDGL